MVAGGRLVARSAAEDQLRDAAALVFALLTPCVQSDGTGLAGGTDTATVVGTGFAGMLQVVISQALNTAVQEKSWRTVESLATTSVGMTAALSGRSVGTTVQALLGIPVSWLALTLLYGVPHAADPVLVLTATMVGIAATYTVLLELLALFMSVRF